MFNHTGLHGKTSFKMHTCDSNENCVVFISNICIYKGKKGSITMKNGTLITVHYLGISLCH